MKKTLILCSASLLFVVSGCMQSTAQAPASSDQIRASIQKDPTATPEQKQSTADAMKNGDINAEIRRTGKLPDGRTVPVPGQPPTK